MLRWNGHHHPKERVTFESPWGESAVMEVVVVDGGARIVMGNLQIDVSIDRNGKMSSFAVDNGFERAVDFVTAERKSALSVDPNQVNFRPYELIASELSSNYSAEFINSMRKGSPFQAAPAAWYGDCQAGSVTCGASLVTYGFSIFGLMGACNPGSAALTCLGALIGHQVTIALAVYTCYTFLVCLADNCS